MRVGVVSWNIHKKPAVLPWLRHLFMPEADYHILQVIEAGSISVRDILAELPPDYRSLNLPIADTEGELRNASGIKVFTNLPKANLRGFTHDVRHIIFYALQVGERRILVAGVHFPSKFPHENPRVQEGFIQHEFSQALQAQFQLQLGKKLFHPESDHLLLMGDFNMAPFELGMVDSLFLHAGGSQQLVTERLQRKVGATYPKLYNPMWSLMGDFVPGTGAEKLPGTYFFANASRSYHYHWHQLDSALFSAPLSLHLVKSTLEIVPLHELIGVKFRTFIQDYSDHFPIRFQLAFS